MAAITTVAGCGNQQPAHKPSSSPTPTHSADPQAAEKQAVLDVYRKMNETEAGIYAKGKYDDSIEKYAGDKALSAIKATMLYYQNNGTVMEGKVKRSPKVTALNTDSDPMKAIVTDCADSSDYTQVDAKTGKAVPYDGPKRHIITSTALRTDDEPWKFYKSVIDRERTC